MKSHRKLLLPEVEDSVDLIGEFIEYFGFKKVHGRIWACLFVSNKPLDAAELMGRLRVSKALVSISIRDLMEYDVILEGARSASGTRTYVVNPEVMDVITGVLRRREKRLLSRIRSATESLRRFSSAECAKHDLDEGRIVALDNMVGCASEALEGIVALRDISLGIWSNFNLGPPSKGRKG